MFRVDQLVAALARNRLWLTDAYYAGTTSYVQALRAAAKDGVDVRLLVPNATDIPILRPFREPDIVPYWKQECACSSGTARCCTRRPPSQTPSGRASVRRISTSRVGSATASWTPSSKTNAFAREMEEMYLQDLENATEIVLDAQHKVRAPSEPRHPHPVLTSGGGSGGRAAAGAIRIGNAVGAAFTNRRVLEPVEARIMLTVGVLLLALAILFAFFPRLLVYPLIVVFVWIAVSLLYRGYKLHRRKGHVGQGGGRHSRDSDRETRMSAIKVQLRTNASIINKALMKCWLRSARTRGAA